MSATLVHTPDPAPTPTPRDLTIKVRDLSFGRDGAHPRWWLNNDPVPTAVFNAVSATFPQGERFFMDAVRRYRSAGSDELRAQIAAFLAQEALHTREHLAFNQQTAAHGYDVVGLENRTKVALDVARARSPLQQLAATCALEHFTAILAHEVLRRPEYFANASPEARRLWTWHAMEEIEHKAVAFDTFIQASQHLSGFKRWALRSIAMMKATRLFISVARANMRDLYRQDGINTGKTWRRTAYYLFIGPGLLRRVFWRYMAYYRPGYHPWKHDDRALLAKADAALGSPQARAA